MFFDFTKKPSSSLKRAISLPELYDTLELDSNNYKVNVYRERSRKTIKKTLSLTNSGINNSSKEKYLYEVSSPEKIKNIFIYSLDMNNDVYRTLECSIAHQTNGYFTKRISDNTIEIFSSNENFESNSVKFCLDFDASNQNISILSINQELEIFEGNDGETIKTVNLFLSISSSEISSNSIIFNYELSKSFIPTDIHTALYIEYNNQIKPDIRELHDSLSGKIELNDLTSNTDYFANIYAECEYDNQKIKSNNITIYFKTLPIYVTGITIPLNSSNITVEENKTYQLSYSVNPSNANNKEVFWTSENEQIATVDNTGLVYGKSEGNTIIKCTSVENKDAFGVCNVTVTKSEEWSFVENENYTYRIYNDKEKTVYITHIGNDNWWLTGDFDIANLYYSDDGTIESVWIDGSPIIYVNKFEICTSAKKLKTIRQINEKIVLSF